ncbi:hypothetical protein F4V58_03515 [Corynebacterium phocae]|nr:hypothetical protein F4V58_03515 [Corynebacterium phocae]
MAKESVTLSTTIDVQQELNERPDLNANILNAQFLELRSLDWETRFEALKLGDILASQRGGYKIAEGQDDGEASCIAVALLSQRSGLPCVLIDDGAGRRLAREKALVCLTTLDLLACLVRLEILSREDAEGVVDRLGQPHGPQGAEKPYRLPFADGGEFSRAYQLYGKGDPPIATENCEPCLEANNIQLDAPKNFRRSFCHLFQSRLD